jgi:hypothetical protein
MGSVIATWKGSDKQQLWGGMALGICSMLWMRLHEVTAVSVSSRLASALIFAAGCCCVSDLLPALEYGWLPCATV